MKLDSQVQSMLEMLASHGSGEPTADPVQQARDNVRAFTGMAGAPEPVGEVTDQHVEGTDSPLSIRIYRPSKCLPANPCIVYFHGGGHVTGSIETVDVLCRLLTNRCAAIVVSVDYRLAPEHPFPAGPQDCFSATKWVMDHAGSLGIDPARISVAGDSAGGNLATGVCLMAKDRPLAAAIAAQLLFYPNVDLTDRFYASKNEENAADPFLPKTAIDWFYGLYMGAADRLAPLASPIQGDLAGLPPALVLTAGFDPLRDEGRAYAAKLQQAGVIVEHVEFGALPHGFLSMTGMVDQSHAAIEQVAAFYKTHLNHAL